MPTSVPAHIADQTSPEDDCVPLTELKPGELGRVRGLRLSEEDAATVRAMGVHDTCDLRICRSARICVVQVLGGGGTACRIALDRDLARDVLVTPMTIGGRPVDVG